eukprot:gene6696-3028_t
MSAAGAAGRYGGLPLYVRAAGGSVLAVEAPADAAVDDLRRLVEEAGGPPPHAQQLSYAGRELCDGAALLS